MTVTESNNVYKTLPLSEAEIKLLKAGMHRMSLLSLEMVGMCHADHVSTWTAKHSECQAMIAKLEA